MKDEKDAMEEGSSVARDLVLQRSCRPEATMEERRAGESP
jgi:hypothetical protein